MMYLLVNTNTPRQVYMFLLFVEDALAWGPADPSREASPFPSRSERWLCPRLGWWWRPWRTPRRYRGRSTPSSCRRSASGPPGAPCPTSSGRKRRAQILSWQHPPCLHCFYGNTSIHQDISVMRVSVEERKDGNIICDPERFECIPFQPLQKKTGGALVLKKQQRV